MLHLVGVTEGLRFAPALDIAVPRPDIGEGTRRGGPVGCDCILTTGLVLAAERL